MIGLFGGAFDPPHRGHVELVRRAKDELGLERLIVLVEAAPGHKLVETPADVRLRLTRAAFPDDIIEVLAGREDAAAAVIRRDPAVRDVQAFGERLHVRVPRGNAAEAASRLSLACREARVDVASVRTVPASLEDVFIDRVVTTPEQSAV